MDQLSSNNRPLVIFVILNWNQVSMTIECLESLRKQNYPNFKVVVVDNGSSDDSVERIQRQFSEVILMENKINLGYSEGNNIGIRKALQIDSPYVFLLNNDTIVDPEMLLKLITVAESDSEIGIAGPTMFYAEPSDMIWCSENRFLWKSASTQRKQMGGKINRDDLEKQKPIQVDYIDTCAVLIKSETLKAIGLMNPSYFINFDDLDLNVRANHNGWKIVYVPSAVMWHKVSATMGLASPATTYYMTRNQLYFFHRNAPGIWKWIAPLRIMIRTVRTVLAWTIKKEYHTKVIQRKRDANLLALRDFLLKRMGKMGRDVEKVCYQG